MTINEAVNIYLAHKRSLGMQRETAERILRAFSRAMGNVDLAAVHEVSAKAYIFGSGPVTSNFITNCKPCAASTGTSWRAATSNDPHYRLPYPKSRTSSCLTFILGLNSVASWMPGTSSGFGARSRTSPCMPLLLLLYGAGLRISEALRLTMADVDWEQRLLSIRQTKFYKSRLVPVGPDLCHIMGVYLARRAGKAPPRKTRISFPHDPPRSSPQYPTRRTQLQASLPNGECTADRRKPFWAAFARPSP